MTEAKILKDEISMTEVDVSKQILTLREDIDQLAAMLKAQAKSVVDQKKATVKTAVIDTVEVVKNAKAEKTESAKQTYDELLNQAEVSIRENPLNSVAIAVGAGFLLAAVFRR